MVLYDCLIKTQHFAQDDKSKYKVCRLPDDGWLTNLFS